MKTSNGSVCSYNMLGIDQAGQQCPAWFLNFNFPTVHAQSVLDRRIPRKSVLSSELEVGRCLAMFLA